ncbi:hypothetical protein GLW04_01160 [Halobacillus litoralis]|uniref:Uncharacterized protein n=1 Tax=Halobacillus litoralis TaxID=45668 RepID=A0A845DWM5_9BACI|nr:MULTISPECIES: hypothetical protein [Halobacillus]MCA1022476.1 hypothetical protein [Halobacillus litoralis]MYL18477.1 hypothetical protein [Halobacillus litoralis]MYL30517.1 hypothetical protein [Halobacillus halophilus]MYL38884.1 hypothetical protein [Halobacillus litoralis]
MSEKKKVIHVKDLVIKADNVIIEPQHRGRHDRDESSDRVDPFFGRKRREAGADESSSSSKRRHDDESSDRRGGFRWF